MKQVHVLVVGAGGFLGSHMCHFFSKHGYLVAGVGRPPVHLDKEPYAEMSFFQTMTIPDDAFSQVLTEFSPDATVYCAGTASVKNSVQAPHQDFRDSVDPLAFTLEAIRRNVPECKFVFLSSAAVYGNPRFLPIKEDSECLPISPYGYHKKMCELLVEEYANLHGICASMLRVFSAYGERLQRQVVHDLFQKITSSDLNAVEVYGTGQESRDFIHADDIARAVECMIRSGDRGLYNLATGEQTTIRELVYLIRDVCESKKVIEFNQIVRPGDPLNWQADVSKIESLGFSPQVSLPQGIQNYYQWLLSRGQ